MYCLDESYLGCFYLYFISLLFWWKLLRCFYLCFLGLFVLMRVTWHAFCLWILYRWKLLEILLVVFFKFICFDVSYLDAFCLCFECLEFSSWKKIKLKTFLLTSISILLFSYRTPPVAASVFLPGIKNLNDIALAIKTKPYGKKLQLPGVCLEPCKIILTESFCENIPGFKSWTIFLKRLRHRCLIWFIMSKVLPNLLFNFYLITTERSYKVSSKKQ